MIVFVLNGIRHRLYAGIFEHLGGGAFVPHADSQTGSRLKPRRLALLATQILELTTAGQLSLSFNLRGHRIEYKRPVSATIALLVLHNCLCMRTATSCTHCTG